MLLKRHRIIQPSTKLQILLDSLYLLNGKYKAVTAVFKEVQPMEADSCGRLQPLKSAAMNKGTIMVTKESVV